MPLLDSHRKLAEEATLSLMYDLFLALRSESWRVADDLWLTPTQVAILTVVTSRRAPFDVGQIARKLGCSHSVISRSLANLEYKAFVRMRPSRRDRRRRLVELRSGSYVSGAARLWYRRVPDAVALLTSKRLVTLRDGLEGLIDEIRLVDSFKRRS